MPVPKCTAWLLAICVGYAHCGPQSISMQSGPANLLGEADALKISNEAAPRFGVDLTKWHIDHRPVLTDDKSEWLVHDNDGARNPGPGEEVLIAVNRKTGIAKRFPLE
jgi:hypothetical protein